MSEFTITQLVTGAGILFLYLVGGLTVLAYGVLYVVHCAGL
jgi:hypothetical protein